MLMRINYMIKRLCVIFSAAAVALCGCTHMPKESPPANEPAKEEQPAASEELPDEKAEIKIGATMGAGSVSIAHLAANGDDGSAYEKYSAKIYPSANELMGEFAKGEVDAAILSPDKAAKLCNEYGYKCKVVAVSGTCNYYLMENGGTPYSDITELDGRQITVNEADKMAEPLLDKIAEYNNISFTYSYKENNDKLTAGLEDGSVELALLQEPYCSEAELKNPNVSVVLDLYDYWDEAADCPFVTSCLVVSDKYIEGFPNVLDLFIRDYVASVSITKHNTRETADLVERYGLFGSKEAVEKALPGCGIGIQTGADMKEELQKLYALLYDLSIDSVGRKIPDDDFYYVS